MAFVSDSDIRDRLEDLLQVLVSGTLDSFWSRIAQDSNAAAYGDIVSALASRGYSAAQIAGWDRGPEFNKDIALFWALTKGMVTKDIPKTAEQRIRDLDRRLELLTVPVTVGGELVAPGADEPGNAGSIGYGDMRRDDDLFTLDWRP